MKKRLFSILVAAFLLIVLCPTALGDGTAVNVTAFGWEYYDLSAEVCAIVNEERAAAGLSPLSRNAHITELAMQRAAEIALYYSHTRPDGTSCFTVFDGLNAYKAENIAAGYASPEAVMEGWMNSEGHRANILNGVYSYIGVGCFKSASSYCWVQLFSSNIPDTTPTDNVDAAVPMCRSISTLPEYIDADISCGSNVTVDVGQSLSFTVQNVNPVFAQCRLMLVPEPVGNDQLVAIDVENGSVTITGLYPCTTEVALPVYPGEASPLSITVTVTGASGLPGDANSDGVVNSADALLIMRFSLGAGGTLPPNADFDGDGIINSADALLVLRSSMGL